MASRESQARAKVLSDAERYVKRLGDEPLLRASFSYGGELRLHFGRPVSHENPRLVGRTHGEWVLGLRATPWVLVGSGAILSRSHDEQQHALRHFEQLEGKLLNDARLRHSDAAITLRFDEDSWFMALTEPRPRARNSLELWELLTPEEVFVVAQPDRTLAVIDASARLDADNDRGHHH